MNFKKNILKPAISLFGAHLVGLIVSFIFCIATSSIQQNPKGLLFSAIVILVVYSVAIYAEMWGQGNKDYLINTRNNSKKKYFKGFQIGILASIPNLILSILFILSYFNLFYNFIPLYRALNSEVVPLMNFIKDFTNNAYLPSYDLWQIFAIASLSLIPAFIAGGCYILGLHNFSPLRRLMYKKDDKKLSDKK